MHLFQRVPNSFLSREIRFGLHAPCLSSYLKSWNTPENDRHLIQYQTWQRGASVLRNEIQESWTLYERLSVLKYTWQISKRGAPEGFLREEMRFRVHTPLSGQLAQYWNTNKIYLKKRELFSVTVHVLKYTSPEILCLREVWETAFLAEKCMFWFVPFVKMHNQWYKTKGFSYTQQCKVQETNTSIH